MFHVNPDGARPSGATKDDDPGYVKAIGNLALNGAKVKGERAGAGFQGERLLSGHGGTADVGGGVGSLGALGT